MSSSETRFRPFEESVVESPTPARISVFTELLDRAASNATRLALFDEEPEPESEEESAEVVAAREAERKELYDRGVADGRAAVEAEYGDAAVGFSAAIEELVQSRREMCGRHETELLELAVKVARKIVNAELAEAPDRWLGMIREGVSRTLGRDSVRIRVGRSLHHYLEPRMTRLRSTLEDVKELELVQDPALPASGCVVETEFGDLDLDAGSKLAALRAKLLEKE